MNEVAARIKQNGFAFVPQLKLDDLSEASMSQFGDVWTDGTFAPVQHLRPRETGSVSTAHYSGVYGLGEFPPHTDLAHLPEPPRYFVLRAVAGCPGTTTALVDGIAVTNAVGHECLSRSLVRGRKFPFNNRLLRLYDTSGKERVRWDPLFLVPASDAGQLGLHLFSLALTKAVRTNVTLARRGDTLIVDNWRMLHGRSDVMPADLGRHLMRAYYQELSVIHE